MFNCSGCWDNPCTCGKEYEYFTVDGLKALIKILNAILARKQDPRTESEKFVIPYRPRR